MRAALRVCSARSNARFQAKFAAPPAAAPPSMAPPDKPAQYGVNSIACLWLLCSSFPRARAAAAAELQPRHQGPPKPIEVVLSRSSSAIDATRPKRKLPDAVKYAFGGKRLPAARALGSIERKAQPVKDGRKRNKQANPTDRIAAQIRFKLASNWQKSGRTRKALRRNSVL